MFPHELNLILKRNRIHIEAVPAEEGVLVVRVGDDGRSEGTERVRVARLQRHERLREKSSKVNRMAAEMSHEKKNPVNQVALHKHFERSSEPSTSSIENLTSILTIGPGLHHRVFSLQLNVNLEHEIHQVHDRKYSSRY